MAVLVKVGSNTVMVNGSRCEGHDLSTEKLSVCLPPGTYSRINAIRGKENRAEFLRRILLEALDEIEEPASTQDW